MTLHQLRTQLLPSPGLREEDASLVRVYHVESANPRCVALFAFSAPMHFLCKLPVENAVTNVPPSAMAVTQLARRVLQSTKHLAFMMSIATTDGKRP